jgi:hypothetical protein
MRSEQNQANGAAALALPGYRRTASGRALRGKQPLSEFTSRGCGLASPDRGAAPWGSVHTQESVEHYPPVYSWLCLAAPFTTLGRLLSTQKENICVIEIVLMIHPDQSEQVPFHAGKA